MVAAREGVEYILGVISLRFVIYRFNVDNKSAV